MWNEPSKKRLAQIPALYSTEKKSTQDKHIYLHFFLGGCDWYIAEFDGNDLFWGVAILNDDLINSEWGYISFSELKAVKVGNIEIDCELDWHIRPVSEICKICQAQGWYMPDEISTRIETPA